MTESISIWHLVLNASVVVKLVMLVLMSASVASWTVIVQRRAEMARARRASAEFEERFWSGIELSRLYHELDQAPDEASGMENIFRAGFKEFARLSHSTHVDPTAVMNGVERAMRVALAREQARLEYGLPFLATVASSSPYIGLFGTVWGIMSSFLSLANTKQSSLAVVAPGIAEALIATAIGLFAAIPAVIAYNRFASVSDALMADYETFAQEFSAILHRRVHAEAS